jgi:hypothetical protein
MDVLALAATVLLCLAASGVIAWWRAREEVRNGFAQARSEVADLLERARLSLATAQESIDASAERAARERARVEQAERRATARPASAPARPYANAQGYKRHLARGGARDHDFERSLGWGGGGNGGGDLTSH